jgi:PAS domain-containing protein
VIESIMDVAELVRSLPLPAALLDGAGVVVAANDDWLALGLAEPGAAPRPEALAALGRPEARAAAGAGVVVVLGGTACLESPVRRLDDLLQALPVVVLLTRVDDGCIALAGAEAGRMAGRDTTDLHGLTVMEVGFHGDPAARKVIIDEAGRHGNRLRNLLFEPAFPHRRMLNLSSVTPLDFNGRQHFCSVVLDVTERGEEEERLRESQEAYAAAFAAFPLPTLLFDHRLALAAANAPAEQMLGRDALQDASRPMPHPTLARAADGGDLPAAESPSRAVQGTRRAVHGWRLHFRRPASEDLRAMLVDVFPLPHAADDDLDVMVVIMGDAP